MMKKFDTTITLHSMEKDKVYNEEYQVENMVDLSRVLISLTPRKGYRIVHIDVQEFEGLV